MRRTAVRRPLLCRTPRCLVRAGAVYYDLSLGYLDEDGIAGRRDLAKPRCSTASMTMSAAIPAPTRRRIITRRWSAAPSIPTGGAGGRSFRSAAKGRERGWQGVSLAGIRIKILRVRYADAGLDEPQQRRQLSFHSRRRPEHDRYPNDWREMTRYSATLSQQAGSGSLSFNGIWVRMSATTAGAPISWGTPTAMASSITTCTPSRVRIFITAIIRWWASPFRCRSGRRAA